MSLEWRLTSKQSLNDIKPLKLPQLNVCHIADVAFESPALVLNPNEISFLF